MNPEDVEKVNNKFGTLVVFIVMGGLATWCAYAGYSIFGMLGAAICAFIGAVVGFMLLKGD